MFRSTEELYKIIYATALQTIADARGLDAFDINAARDLANKHAELCMRAIKDFCQKLK